MVTPTKGHIFTLYRAFQDHSFEWFQYWFPQGGLIEPGLSSDAALCSRALQRRNNCPLKVFAIAQHPQTSQEMLATVVRAGGGSVDLNARLVASFKDHVDKQI